jgi:FkbM family methyltransferase
MMSEIVALGKKYRDVSRYKDCFVTIDSLLNLHQPEILCDIGANSGSWTYVVSQLDTKLKEVTLFEPQEKYFRQLEKMPMKQIKKNLFNFGLGNKNEKLFITGGTASASFLAANDNQNRYFPKSLLEDKQLSRVMCLDDVYSKYKLSYPDTIKIDVQGFELKVLKGAKKVLSKAEYLVIELSLRNFYSGQPKLHEILEFLDDNHYFMVGRGYEWVSSDKKHEILQFDGIFHNDRY